MYCASDYRSMARRALKNFWWLAVGVTLLATVLGGGTSSLTVSFQNSDVSRYYPEAMRRFTHVLVPVASVLAMGQFVLRGSISIGHDRFCLKLVDGEQAQFDDLFSAFDIFGSAFVLNLLIALKVFAWSLLFVIPGIIAAYRYRFAYYNLCENPDMGVMEALNMSKAQTGGFKWQLFVLDLSFLGWMLLCGLTLGILSIWVQPYILQTNVGYFQQIKAAKGIGWTPRGPEGEDHTFHPNDPFDNTDNTGL